MKQKTTAKTIRFQTTRFTPRTFPTVSQGVSYFISIIKKHTSSIKDSLDQTLGKKHPNFKKILPIAILIVVLGGVIVQAGRMVTASSKVTSQKETVKGAKATVELNKEFSFPILDARGKEVTKLKYFVQNAELRDEIIVKGSRATAVEGRTFLILNIKIANDYDKGIDINARDYVRLVINNNEQELLAADIHNDPVSVQPISTKITRLGFPINDTDKNIVLKVGEIKGEKQSVPLNF